MMSTNSDYLNLRDYYYTPHYFPNRARVALRNYYHYCFESQMRPHINGILSRQAAHEARKPWLSTTARQRYYDQYSYLRKLRSIGEGKDVNPIPHGKQRIQCDTCDTHEDLGSEIDERTLEGAGWYLGPARTLCPECAEED